MDKGNNRVTPENKAGQEPCIEQRGKILTECLSGSSFRMLVRQGSCRTKQVCNCVIVLCATGTPLTMFLNCWVAGLLIQNNTALVQFPVILGQEAKFSDALITKMARGSSSGWNLSATQIWHQPMTIIHHSSCANTFQCQKPDMSGLQVFTNRRNPQNPVSGR